MQSSLFEASAWVIPIILAVTLHESAHGWVAERFGDPTARHAGRVSFNPIKHIDPLGTIILPFFLLLVRSPVLFGYAKPVPVDFNQLNPRYLGMLSVAAAGPGTNILLALASGIMLHFWPVVDPGAMSWLQLNLYNSMLINCTLAVFNMIPVLPFDGGRVLRSLLPGRWGATYAKSERYGLIVIILLFLLLPSIGITIAADILTLIIGLVLRVILYLTGTEGYLELPV